MIAFDRASKAEHMLFALQPERQLLARTHILRLRAYTPRTARNRRNHRRQTHLASRTGARHRVRARRIGAELEAVVAPHKVPHQQLLEPRPSIRIRLLLPRIPDRRSRRGDKQVPHKVVWRNERTSLRHAAHRMLRLVTDLRDHIVVPAIHAECVFAIEA